MMFCDCLCDTCDDDEYDKNIPNTVAGLAVTPSRQLSSSAMAT